MLNKQYEYVMYNEQLRVAFDKMHCSWEKIGVNNTSIKKCTFMYEKSA